VRSRLFVSESCPLILPFHVEVDRAREALRETSGSGKIGTTGKGIGPAYEDKVARRACACRTSSTRIAFPQKLRELLELHNAALTGYLKSKRRSRSSRSSTCDEGGRAGCKPMLADVGLPPAARSMSLATTCCSRVRRARCWTSTTAPTRT
jgi:adenylosuccinate synthase